MSESDHGLTRRQFLGLTGGLIISFTIPARFATAADDAEAAAEDINAWLRIGPDSKVTVFAGKVEIGQGLRTSFAQMAAEELTVPVANVEVVLADTDLTPFDEGTWGSLSVRTVGRQIMAAAAKAREILTQMAAEKWGVSADKVTVSDGRASLVGNASTSVALGELTQGRRITRQLQGEPKLRPPDTHEAIGASVKRVEGPAVVTGQEQFVGDVRLPGMLYGAVLYPPSFGAKLTSVDASRAEKAPGVVALVQKAGIVGIVADRPDIAQDARSLIRATWSEAANPSMDVLWDSFRRTAKLEDTVVEDGKVEPALASAARTFTATYRTAFLAHAPMEPHIAVASVENGKALVYSSTQTPFPHRDEVAKALGIDKKNVHVIAPRVGGGFGGRESADCAVAAALMSRRVGRPVMVGQTRSEELTWNYFKPAALIDVRCGVDGGGRIVAWDCDVYNCGDRGAEPPYGFTNRRVRTFGCDSPLAQGAWRGLAGSATTFAIEMHMDEMAAKLRHDPVEFRLAHLDKDPRLAKTVKAVAERYGWQPRTSRTGKGIGLACANDAGSACAEIAEVEVDRKTGLLKVNRVVVAHESGLVINPDGITNQIEGGITMGLGMVLREQVRYDKGKILTDRYSTYRIPTIQDVPKIETVLVPNPSHPSEGAGEPPIFPIAAAVASAVYDATGKRFRELPLSADTVLAALRV
jgi:isoquinoline 1-oxidoreductase